MDAGLQDDTDIDLGGDELLDEVDDAAVDELPEDQEGEGEPDPLAGITAEIATLKQELARLRGLDAKVNPALAAVGRMQNIQSELDALKNRPASDPRLDLYGETLTSLADALSASDIIDDESRQSIRAAKSRLDQARTKESETRLRRELLEEVRAAAGGDRDAQEEAPDADLAALAQAVQQETFVLRGYAGAKGVDWGDIPEAELQFRDGETVEAASRRVRSVIDSIADGDATATDVGRRRRSARRPAPPRAGAALSDTELIDDYALHPEKYTSDAAKQKVYDALARL